MVGKNDVIDKKRLGKYLVKKVNNNECFGNRNYRIMILIEKGYKHRSLDLYIVVITPDRSVRDKFYSSMDSENSVKDFLNVIEFCYEEDWSLDKMSMTDVVYKIYDY